MLSECRLALRITTDAYDGELASLMDAAASDLKIAGVMLPGSVSFETESTETDGVTTYTIVDKSTLKDRLVQRAIFTYVRMHFGSPNDYDRLKESYNIQKVQLMHADRYTEFYGGDDR